MEVRGQSEDGNYNVSIREEDAGDSDERLADFDMLVAVWF